MKNIKKYGMAFLLIAIFSLKLLAPEFFKFNEIKKTLTEQQEDKNTQEKEGEKSGTIRSKPRSLTILSILRLTSSRKNG